MIGDILQYFLKQKKSAIFLDYFDWWDIAIDSKLAKHVVDSKADQSSILHLNNVIMNITLLRSSHMTVHGRGSVSIDKGASPTPHPLPKTITIIIWAFFHQFRVWLKKRTSVLLLVASCFCISLQSFVENQLRSALIFMLVLSCCEIMFVSSLFENIIQYS